MSTAPPSWDLIAAYLAVRRHGSLSAASRALKVSQPTVRRQIEALEQALGVSLFSRDPTGLVPIDGGDALRTLAESIEASVMAFQRTATSAVDAPAGIVRLTCPAVFAVEIVPPILAGVRERYPLIVTELVVSNRIDDLLRRDADLAIRLATPEQGALVARRLAPVVVALYAAPGAVSDLARTMTFAAYCESGPFIGDDRRRLIASGFDAAGMPSPQRVVLRTDDDVAQIAAIRAGLGLGVCQERVAARYGLVRHFPEISQSIDAFLVVHEDQRRVARIRVVADALFDALRPDAA
jgi:DNA-binding transcriptional LysR family regulator